MGAAEAKRAPGPAAAGAPAEKITPIPLERMAQSAHVVGELLIVTLPEAETIEEGLQEIERWKLIGPYLTVNQWLQVSNDAGSMFRVMRVERLHGARGAGLRALVLRDVVPPRVFDVENEPVIATGDWYCRYLGPHRRWAIVTPAGVVRREGIHSEAEARNVLHAESGNPTPR